jgi:TonB-dependent starch-binding outer membrane protein SusC
MRISKLGIVAMLAFATGWPAATSALVPTGPASAETSVASASETSGSASVVLGASSPSVPVGTITGLIRDRAGLAPIAAAQVFIPGTGIAALTGANGRFVLAQVPAGTVTVRVERLGYQSVSQEITVVDGQTVELNFELASQALALDQIVVTGTAGGTQRRAIGNVVDQIAATSAVEISPATSLNQLISQRSPGVQLQGQSGTVGAGAPIHIRGVTSLSLGATPIIFIDGVRMDSRHDTGPTQRGGSRVSRLDDINLEDVESIRSLSTTLRHGE